MSSSKALAAVLLVAASGVGAQEPDWILNPPKRGGWVHVVGSGQSKIDAVADAYAKLAASIPVRPARSSDTTGSSAAGDEKILDIFRAAIRATTAQRVGPILVRALEEKFSSTVRDSAGQETVLNTYRRAVQVTSADSSMHIRTFQSSESDGSEDESLRTVSLEGELRVFVDALTGLGARITTHETPFGYHMLVALPERALLP